MIRSYFFAFAACMPLWTSAMEQSLNVREDEQTTTKKNVSQEVVPYCSSLTASKTTSAVAPGSFAESARNAAESELCKIFEVDPLLCTLPAPAQVHIVKKLKALYPKAFSDWSIIQPSTRLEQHRDDIERTISFAPDLKRKDGITDLLLIDGGKTLISCSADGHIAFWHIPTLNLIRELTIKEPIVYKNLSSLLGERKCLLAVNEEETLLAISIEDKVHIYELKTLEKKRVLNVKFQAGTLGFLKKTPSSADLLIVAPHRRSALTETDGNESAEGFQLWDVITGLCSSTFLIGRSIHGTAFDAAKTRFAVLNRDDEHDTTYLSIYDCLCGNPQQTYEQIVSDYASFDGLTFLDRKNLIFCVESSILVLLTLDNQAEHHSYKGPFIDATLQNIHEITARIVEEEKEKKWPLDFPAYNLSYDANKGLLCCALSNGITAIYDLRTGKKMIPLVDPQKHPDDPAVKCLIHPEHFLCFTLRQMGYHEQYAVLNVWNIPLIHSSISEDMLLIKQALLIILMQTLKDKTSNLKLLSFTGELRKEVAKVFHNFTRTQKEFIRLIFFR